MDYFLQHSQYIGFIVSALLGGYMHYLKKFLRKETTVSMSEWFGKANLPATLYTLIAFIFSIIGVLSTDVITMQTELFVAMYTGFVTGFTIDAGFNSDAGFKLTSKE